MAGLVTARLILRQWQDGDYQPFAHLNADPMVMAYFPATLDEDESFKMADKCRQLISNNGWGFWAAELKETSEFIGFIGLHKPNIILPCSPCVEIGWRLAKEYWGKGLATEAAKAVLAYGFTTLLLEEIVSFTVQQNLRSQAVMRRLGMTYRTTFNHPSLAEASPLLVHDLFYLTKIQWLRLCRQIN